MGPMGDPIITWPPAVTVPRTLDDMIGGARRLLALQVFVWTWAIEP